MSVSISSNLMEEPNFLCNSDPHHLVAFFVGPLEGLASQSKEQMKLLNLDVDTTIKILLGNTLEKHTQSHKRREKVIGFDMTQDDCEN